MKNKILLGAGALCGVATINGIGTALFGHDPEWVLRLNAVSFILVAGSIGLFFIGWVFPKETKTTIDGITSTTSEK